MRLVLIVRIRLLSATPRRINAAQLSHSLVLLSETKPLIGRIPTSTTITHAMTGVLVSRWTALQMIPRLVVGVVVRLILVQCAQMTAPTKI